jgi:hypothetical protein
MPKFTKKPVEVEARQFDGTQGSAKAVCAWMAAYGCEALRAFCGHDEPYQVYISTLEGRMTASAGDWIIRGVKGEFYPCKPDIFAETYEPAALSHAAGQDGEQCRAASGELEELRAWKAEHQAFLVRLSVALVVDGGCKQDQIEACVDELIAERDNLRALSRGVPEGMVLVPRSSAEMAAVVCDEWGELFVGTPGFDKYERFNYGPAVEMLRDELRAIAAQRKEGE